jgi:8-oxo-dGTP pyrophosphatase MutT (NUDIX family)
MTQPWRVLDSSPVHRDRWIDVRADRCVTAAGHEVSPYYVLRYPDFVHAVALTEDRRLVLVEQYRHAASVVTLELPGGQMDASDTDPAATARRELLEETGYACRDSRTVSSMFVNPATHTNRIHAVLATGCTLAGSPAREAAEEGMRVHVLPLEDVLAGLAGGLLSHSMQVACLAMALPALGVSWP